MFIVSGLISYSIDIKKKNTTWLAKILMLLIGVGSDLLSEGHFQFKSDNSFFFFDLGYTKWGNCGGD